MASVTSSVEGRALQEWANRVGLELEPRLIDSKTHPDLAEVIQRSRLVPEWLSNKDANEYSNYRHTPYKLLISELANSSKSNRFLKLTNPSDDPLLAQELASSVSDLFKLANMNARFAHERGFAPTETDRRGPMDALSADVWTVHSGPELLLRMEYFLRGVQYPRNLSEIRPDLSLFIQLSLDLSGKNTEVYNSCSSVSKPDLAPEYALHWATEYKREANRFASRRQVLEALVTGLYQRRALGFADHFIFGMAHHSSTQVDIIAATWEPINSTNLHRNPVGGSNSHDFSTAHESSDQGATSITEEIDGLDPAIKKVLENRKIVIYNVTQWNMLAIGDILALYLFMRSIRRLGLKYRQDINDNFRSRLDILLELAPENYTWATPSPSALRPPSRSNSRGPTKRKLDAIDENPGDYGDSPYSDQSAMFSPRTEGCDSDEYDSDPDIDSGVFGAPKEYCMNFLENGEWTHHTKDLVV